MRFNRGMRTQTGFTYAAILLASWLSATAGCSSPAGAPARSAAGRPAIRVQAQTDGRVSLEGESLRLPALARRLRHEGPGRAVVLSGAPGVPDLQLVSIRDQLVRNGVPNVAIVKARVATATVDDSPDASPDGMPPPAPPPAPARRRTR